MFDLFLFARLCPRQGSFARPALPGVLTTMTPSDSRTDPMTVMDSHHELMLEASPERVSQVPRRICRRPPPPTTPEELTAASARGFTVNAGFTLSGRLALPTLRNEAETGSLALRLASSLPKAPNGKSPRRPLGQLHGARAFPMVSTFQPTRFARLYLTHQRHRGRGEKKRGRIPPPLFHLCALSVSAFPPFSFRGRK